MDGYDQFKLETPEEEDERINGRARRRRERDEWLEEHADYLLEDRLERERERTNDSGE